MYHKKTMKIVSNVLAGSHRLQHNLHKKYAHGCEVLHTPFFLLCGHDTGEAYKNRTHRLRSKSTGDLAQAFVHIELTMSY